MATTSVTISGSKTGTAEGGTRAISPGAISNASASDQYLTQAFTGGTFASVSVPSGSVGLLILPPSNNTGTITLKGVTGDTGVNIHKTNPTLLGLDSGATFGLLCQNSITIEGEWI